VHRLSKAVIDRSPARLRPAVRLTIGTIDGAVSDRLPGLAAEVAFWVLLSLPALLLSAIAVTGFVIGRQDDLWEQRFVERIVEVSRLAFTERTIDGVIRPLVDQLLAGSGIGLASFAFLTTVWVASRAVKVVLQTLSLVYDDIEPRKGWQDRLLGFAITLGALIVGIVLAPLLVAGPGFGAQLVEWIGDDPIGIEVLWRALYYPATVVGGTLAIAALYHLGLTGNTPWRRDLPGAVLAAAVWFTGSSGLRLYGAWIVGSDSAYGPLAGPIVALLWLYLTCLAVLLGAELNAQVERMWPATAGKDAGRGHDREPGVEPDDVTA